jgi:hypothetical protein
MTNKAMDNNELQPMPEQLLYAKILSFGAWTGIFLMIATYLLYVFGVLEPHVPLEQVVNNWSGSIHHFTTTTGSPQGWEWASLLGTGDYINFIGLALLALLTIVCYLVLIPGYLRHKDWTYTTIVVLEVLVLLLAASGILGAGGH